MIVRSLADPRGGSKGNWC